MYTDTKHIYKRHIHNTPEINEGNIKSSRFSLLIISANYHTSLSISRTQLDVWSKQKRGQSEQQWLSTPLLGILRCHGSSLTRCRSRLHANGMAISSLRGWAVTAGTWCPHAHAQTHTQTHSNTLPRAHKPKGKRHTLCFTLSQAQNMSHISWFLKLKPQVCVCVCVRVIHLCLSLPLHLPKL